MLNSALIDDLERQFAENPRRVFARLANEYRKSGELDRAIEICQVHVPQQPGYISGYIVMGQALFESGRLDEAHATFQTALDLDPENLIALRHLGDIAVQSGDPNAARLWYQRLLEIDPQNEEIAAQIEQLATASGDTQPSGAATAESVTWGDVQPDEAAPVESVSDLMPEADDDLVPEVEAAAAVEDEAATAPESELGEMAVQGPEQPDEPAEPHYEPTRAPDFHSFASDAAFDVPDESPVMHAEPPHAGDDFAPGDIVAEADPFGNREDAGRASMDDLSLDGEGVLEISALDVDADEMPHPAALEASEPESRAPVVELDSAPPSPPAVTIRSFLASLAGRRPPRRPAASEAAPVPSSSAPVSAPVPANGAAGRGDGGSLFGGAAVSQADETAAVVLAAAFSEDYLDRSRDSRGQPTRAAANELSLDEVFRDPRAREGDARGGRAVSFDEFFAPRAGEAATQAEEGGDDSAPPKSSSDLELFHAWLEGLKK